MSKLHSPPPEKERTISKPKKRREDSENPTHGSVERSEEHTSELQSQSNLVCRLLLAETNTHTAWLRVTWERWSIELAYGLRVPPRCSTHSCIRVSAVLCHVRPRAPQHCLSSASRLSA